MVKKIHRNPCQTHKHLTIKRLFTLSNLFDLTTVKLLDKQRQKNVQPLGMKSFNPTMPNLFFVSKDLGISSRLH